jgi:hypothetical protein
MVIGFEPLGMRLLFRPESGLFKISVIHAHIPTKVKEEENEEEFCE